MELGDLTTFTDLINTKDVESGSREARHWINSPTGEARGSLGRVGEVWVESPGEVW